MTLYSVADACCCLGVDAKTLRRWLAEVHLPLQDHLHDARKKGVSSEHLHLLAKRHRRLLTPLPKEPAESVPDVLPSFPAALLALPETLGALQDQIAALQQQVAELTALLQPQAQPPTSPTMLTTSAKGAKRSRWTVSPAPRAQKAPSSSAKAPRKQTQVIPLVEYGKQGRYVIICPKRGMLPFEPDSPEWFDWLREQSSFRFVGQAGRLTAHHEWRVKKGAWRAHRHIRNHSYTLRLAPVQELTIAVLEQAAEALQAHLI
jgi:hypothetical protein